MGKQSIRSKIVTKRTYARPIEGNLLESSEVLETWEQIVDRVVAHQAWLWERARGVNLGSNQWAELEDLRGILLAREASVSGRTLWLGGTSISKRREASMFNCAYLHTETIADVVDAIWLLMQGCGVGFTPKVGTLSGFSNLVPTVTVIRSDRTLSQWLQGERGNDVNVTDYDPATGVWRLRIGDSAEAWSKAVGKLLALKERVTEIVLDFSEIRAAGVRLNGYGWISSGDTMFCKAMVSIIDILNRKSGFLLNEIDIIDIMNHLGTILSSRRSAEIALVPSSSTMANEFALMKREYWVNNPQRAQSNNSLLFETKPSKSELEHIFKLMVEGGGCEPGFINAMEARRKAPWFSGVNPCAEILLPNKGFCNLVEIDLAKFKDNPSRLHKVTKIIARANYRQTCVDLRDGILQDAWHQNNQHLHLCGVGVTGVAQRDDMSEYDIMELQRVATFAAYQMADELSMPHPKNVTTIKPSGTMSKIMDTTEGIHKPMGKYIFNKIVFGNHDPMIPKLMMAGYMTEKHPTNHDATLVTFPIAYDNISFEKMKDKKYGEIECNLEPAIDQLERYKKWQKNWCHQNVSQTIYYDDGEIKHIIDWLLSNWDCYVGVSFLKRYNPLLRAEDLGAAYLPQTVVTKAEYDAYVNKLKDVDFSEIDESLSNEIDTGDECATGACPIK
jgi:ribonucleoside-triphosphate reductase